MIRVRAKIIANMLGTILFFIPIISFAQDNNGLLLPSATPSPLPVSPNSSSPDSNSANSINPNTNNDSLKAALQEIVPYTPEQIDKIRREKDAADKAANIPLDNITPISRSLSVSFKSGSIPPVIRVYPGWISTLTFSDITGKDWPIDLVTIGNPAAFDAKSSGPAGNSNILTISTKLEHVSSNLAITLVGAKVPLLITLSPSGGDVDYRTDIKLDARGPNAAYDLVGGNNLPPTNDDLMMKFLDGTPPDSAKKIKTDSFDVETWIYNDMLYVRTMRTLLSPAYIGKQSNASGTNMYVLEKSSPVLLLSLNGQMSYVQVLQ